jgi:DNA-binding IclR family transcriptional regulator
VTGTQGYYVARTMHALELVAFGPQSAPGVADALRVVERTARRLLHRLVDEEYVTYQARTASRGCRRYALSLRLLTVAGQALQRAELPRVAAPFVTLLHEQTGHAAHLLVPSYDGVLCLAHAQAGAQAVPAIRELAPCHCTAGGKALLSERPQWCDAVLGGKLEAFTPRTETDACALRRQLSETAVRGYAIEAGEHKPDQHGLAAVVRTPTGEAVAAIAATTTGVLDVTLGARDVTRTAAAVSASLASEARACGP